MPVYPRTRKDLSKLHVCKPPRCWLFTPWRWGWLEGTVYHCTTCERGWCLKEVDSDDGSFLEWHNTLAPRIGMKSMKPLPFHPVPFELE